MISFSTDDATNVVSSYSLRQRLEASVGAPSPAIWNGVQVDRGLHFYKPRYFDPKLGHFAQPDTIVPSPGDPQNLNRYSYTRNNPLRYTDPSGHCAIAVPPFVMPQCVEGALRLLQQAQALVVKFGPQAGQFLQQFGDKLPAVADGIARIGGEAGNGAQQISDAGGNTGNFQFDPGNFNFDPGKFDPEKHSKQDIGKEAHRQFRQEFRRQMKEEGRVEKHGDFLTEKAVRDVNGKVIRIGGRFGKPDAVDYVNHVIYDLKPWQRGREEFIRTQYQKQFDLYVKLYEQAYGVTPEVQIIMYQQPQ
ncbi:MAG: RHS repeat-associated core domain-containing protein [Gammaproteobacteria bacterium]|nr:RHS repeat-associated core domain-containing protein [Gammaproteobacteria bacterium]